MTRKIYLLVILILTAMSSGFAHALWIETNLNGTLGKEQEVKILYGEYAAGEFEETGKWYSDVNAFALWLTAPDGTKKQLVCKAGDKAFITSFVPDKEGVYVLAIGHSAHDIDGTTVYQFNASAVVTVKGKSVAEAPVPAGNELYLQPSKDATGKLGVVKAFYKGKPAAKITVTVSAPSGWSKNFETDENGVLKFELLWKGLYAIEGFYTTQENGNHDDKSYDQIWRCATVRMNP